MKLSWLSTWPDEWTHVASSAKIDRSWPPSPAIMALHRPTSCASTEASDQRERKAPDGSAFVDIRLRRLARQCVAAQGRGSAPEGFFSRSLFSPLRLGPPVHLQIAGGKSPSQLNSNGLNNMLRLNARHRSATEDRPPKFRLRRTAHPGPGARQILRLLQVHPHPRRGSERLQGPAQVRRLPMPLPNL